MVSSASRGSSHILCLAFAMGELGRAICVGNFKGVFCFTFCYNEVNANCFVCVFKTISLGLGGVTGE